MEKQSIVMGLASVGLTGSASSRPSVSNVNYNAADKTISFNARVTKKANKLEVKYRGKKYTYKVKNGKVSVKDLHFTGYRAFSITGLKNTKKVTAATNLTKDDYTTASVVDYSVGKTSTGYSVQVETLQKQQKVTLDYNNSPLVSQNTKNGKLVKFNLSAKDYKQFADHLTYTVKSENKKTSMPIKIDNLGNKTELNVIA